MQTNSMSENIIGDLDLDQPIYRVTSFYRMENMIFSKKNGLVPPSRWDDPFENFLLRASAEDSNGQEISISMLANAWYGQCWTLNDDTDAMWRIYSHDKMGVKMKTTVRKLFETIWDAADKLNYSKFFIGRVEYMLEADIFAQMNTMTLSEIQSIPINSAKLFLKKRKEFEHEKEVRILYQDSENVPEPKKVELFNFDPNAICEEIVLDPRISDEDERQMTRILRNTGYENGIRRSDLYHVPSFKLKL